MDIVSSVIFPIPPSSYSVESFPGELLFVPRSLNPQTSLPEDFVPLLLLRHLGARFLLIFLHSNFEDLGRCRSFCKAVRDELGVHVLAAEYPGYGVCPGERCDERGATESASTAFRFANEVLRWPAEHILVLGRSVGTGPAVALATEHVLGGLILVSPFLSVCEACREHLGPMANLIEERFPSHERMPHIRAPCLVVHGTRDTTVPVRHGRTLFELCRTRKRLVLPALDHNANLLQSREHFVMPTLQFFGLPQIHEDCQELLVPTWALDRRVAPRALRAVARTQPACLGCRNWPSSCSTHSCACARSWRASLGSPDFVEETIACAVEHILAGGRDDPWGDDHSSKGARLSGTTCPVAPREPSQLVNEEDVGVCDDKGPAPPHPTRRPHLAQRGLHCISRVDGGRRRRASEAGFGGRLEPGLAAEIGFGGRLEPGLVGL